jgi:hypothetical protein
MPIKPENKARYPQNWKAIRARILERAGNCCEQCRAPNGSIVNRGTATKPRPVKVVLTIAHLDHTPENCDESNLLALCQLHHLMYDAQHHARNARATRFARKAAGELPGLK